MNTHCAPRLAAALVLLCVTTPAEGASRPVIHQRPAARGDFTPTSRALIDTIVIHKAEGTNASGWFTNPWTGSAHYDVHRSGVIYQSLTQTSGRRGRWPSHLASA